MLLTNGETHSVIPSLQIGHVPPPIERYYRQRLEQTEAEAPAAVKAATRQLPGPQPSPSHATAHPASGEVHPLDPSSNPTPPQPAGTVARGGTEGATLLPREREEGELSDPEDTVANDLGSTPIALPELPGASSPETHVEMPPLPVEEHR